MTIMCHTSSFPTLYGLRLFQTSSSEHSFKEGKVQVMGKRAFVKVAYQNSHGESEEDTGITQTLKPISYTSKYSCLPNDNQKQESLEHWDFL